MSKKILICLIGAFLGLVVLSVAKPVQAAEMDETLAALKQTMDILQLTLNQLDAALSNIETSQAAAVNATLSAMSVNLSRINLTLANFGGVESQPRVVVAEADGVAPSFEVESANLLESAGENNAFRFPIAQLMIAAVVVAGMIWLFRGAMKADAESEPNPEPVRQLQ